MLHDGCCRLSFLYKHSYLELLLVDLTLIDLVLSFKNHQSEDQIFSVCKQDFEQ